METVKQHYGSIKISREVLKNILVETQIVAFLLNMESHSSQPWISKEKSLKNDLPTVVFVLFRQMLMDFRLRFKCG